MKTTQTVVQTVDSYLTNLVKSKRDGEITLDAIQKEFPMLPRNELIRQVREVNSGKFVIGRRGGASRFLYGAAIVEKPQNQTPRLVKQNRVIGGHGFSLKIRLGDGAIAAEIPVNLELAAA